MFGLFKNAKMVGDIANRIHELLATKTHLHQAQRILTANPYYVGFVVGQVYAQIDILASSMPNEEKHLTASKILSIVFGSYTESFVQKVRDYTHNEQYKLGTTKGYNAFCYLSGAKSSTFDPDHIKAAFFASTFFSPEEKRNMTEDEIANFGFTLIWFSMDYQKEIEKVA